MFKRPLFLARENGATANFSLASSENKSIHAQDLNSWVWVVNFVFLVFR